MDVLTILKQSTGDHQFQPLSIDKGIKVTQCLLIHNELSGIRIPMTVLYLLTHMKLLVFCRVSYNTGP